MRIKQLTTARAIPATATSTLSTTVSIAAVADLAPFNQGATMLVSFNFNAAAHGAGSAALLSATDGTTFSQATDIDGNNVIVTLPDTAAFGGTVKKFVVVNIGQSLKVKVKGTATGGAGTVDVDLVQ